MRLGALLQIVAALHMPDAGHLKYVAARAGVNYRVVLADAWQETGRSLNTRVRDHSCWYSVMDTAGLVTHHERDCAVGRFQIRPSTARRGCPGENVFTYRGNVACFILMFGTNSRAVGVERALFIHNHSRAYVNEVLATVGRIAVTEVDSVTRFTPYEESAVVLERAGGGRYAEQGQEDCTARADGTGVARAAKGARAVPRRDSAQDARGSREHAAAASFGGRVRGVGDVLALGVLIFFAVLFLAMLVWAVFSEEYK